MLCSAFCQLFCAFKQHITIVLLWWVKAVVAAGIVRHFRGWSSHLHYLTHDTPPLFSSVMSQGAKQHLPHLILCTVLREHCGSCSTSWATNPLHHTGVTEEWVRNRM